MASEQQPRVMREPPFPGCIKRKQVGIYSGCLFFMELTDMARDFSRAFYNSAAWKKCREAYKQYKNGLCERCLKEGKYIPGEEVHHKVWLNETNINNPDITLNWDNLELLCSSCHSKEHNSKYEPLRDDVKFDENGDLVRRKQG